MNQRRKLLNAARRGDTKAISKLFELYQVRVLNGDQLAKVNKTSTYMVPVKASQSGKSKASQKGSKSAPPKANEHAKTAKPSAKVSAKPVGKTFTKSAKSTSKLK